MTALATSVWVDGSGPELVSVDPSTAETVWQGPTAGRADVERALAGARGAQVAWSRAGLDARLEVILAFARRLDARRDEVAAAIATEVGKPHWEALTEVAAMVAKVDHAAAAYEDRTPTRVAAEARLTHRALGVVAVLGPYNFPGHLPNGQIVPALLAGNAVVFKPSELTPMVASLTAALWAEAGIPEGVLHVVCGRADVGAALVDGDVDAVLFTGSRRTGAAIHASLASRPEVLLALEMGGNNPLVIDQVGDRTDDLAAAVDLVIRSAFLTSGQRCTCARRLLVRAGHDDFLAALAAATDELVVGGWRDRPEPFMGPVVTAAAARHVDAAADALLAAGGRCLTGRRIDASGSAFVAPTIVDVDAVATVPDEEVFGPLLTVARYAHLDDAIAMANATRYGLSAGIVTPDEASFERFVTEVRAGIVNWNQPLTGASSTAPFGGLGASGNHRPAAWYAADFSAAPVASLTSPTLDHSAPLPGMRP